MRDKIAIFTTFSYYDPAYSLERVAESQIKQLVKNNYKVVTIASEGFTGGGEFDKTEIRHLPSVPLSNDAILPSFEEDVTTLSVKLPDLMRDIRIAFTHDIFFQFASVPYNEALRRYLKQEKDVFLLNWIHSVPSKPPEFLKYPEDCRFKRIPNSYMIYPNEWDRLRVAKMYGVEFDDVKVVHHPIDIAEFLKLEPETCEFAEKYDLYNADIITVYPLRLDRGKQPEKVIQIMAALKNRGLKVKCIIVDFHSTGGDKITLREECKEWAKRTGLSEDLIWTSEFKEEFKTSCPYSFVSDLMRLATIFIMPSRSETFSLITEEAAMAKNLLVLNQDFPPMRDIYGTAPLYFQFGSNVNVLNRDFGSVESDFSPSYAQSIAASIQYHIRNDHALNTHIRVRKNYHLDRVFTDELEPIIASICRTDLLKNDLTKPEQPQNEEVKKCDIEIKPFEDKIFSEPILI